MIRTTAAPRPRLLPRSALLPTVAALAVAALGCGPAATARPASSSGDVAHVAPPNAHAQIVGADDDPGGTASEVFARAKAEMDLGKLAHARALFDRVVVAARAEDPTVLSALARAAAYDAALCSERLGENKDARDRYAALAADAPDSVDATDAQLRRARLDVEIEDDADLAKSSAGLLARKELGLGDRAEALALQSLALVHAGDLASAQKDLLGAEKLLEQLAPGDAPPPPQNAAAVWFAKGEAIRARGLTIALNPPPPDFSAKMEARCQSILDAEDAYVDAIKTEQLQWAVRAGVRVASLYGDLHDDLMSIEAPKSVTTDAKKSLFRGAMRLRYRILLEKGLGTLERTLNLEQTTGVKSTWFEHARQARAKLDKQLADEKAELAKLPYTEEQLKKALDDLAKGEPKTKA